MRLNKFLFGIIATILSTSAFADNESMKAKILTGIEISENEEIPIMLGGEYSFLDPNNKKVNLKNCFYLGKTRLFNNRIIADINQVICKKNESKKNENIFDKKIKGFISENEQNELNIGISGDQFCYSESVHDLISNLLSEIEKNIKMEKGISLPLSLEIIESLKSAKNKLTLPKSIRIESGREVFIKFI